MMDSVSQTAGSCLMRRGRVGLYSKVTRMTWMWLLFVYAIVSVFPEGSR